MNRSAAVTDASVVIPWFQLPFEPFERQCLKLAADFKNGFLQLAAPSLLFYEITNFVARQKQTRFFKEEVFESFLKADFSIHHFGSEEFREIRTIAEKFKLSVYDASYFHLAEILGVPLWTADGDLAGAWGDRPGGHIKNYRSL